ncbi:zinc ribbon domain-containing protein [Mycobacterium sp. OTB74]|uniref:zinc ribbon domain-containing protein n=1 Tax=Mycobacterium sp. OTB74 TaxID=1853452 RepID=UPI0024758B89|nr:zinc ribbon domain-containing protein [Mycobacterium sp. OTB74]MDH6247596.1 hypothetical protein [Mycobacterium sp. OTB74]
MSTTVENPPTEQWCEVCQLDVPAGEYCGLCGTPLSAHRGDGPHWLRARSFSATPGERLLIPRLVSSLFPQLSPRARIAFLIGLLVLVFAMAAASLARLPGALVAVAALGLPLLFALYVREADVDHDMPTGTMPLTAAIGIVGGVGWVLLTGAATARAYGIPLDAGIAGAHVLREGLAVPLGSLLLTILPAVIIRLVRPGPLEALHGYAIGALGALSFTAAATLTRLAPQFTTTGISTDRTMRDLMVEAGIRGVAAPLTSACLGGLIGAALWFTRPPNKAHLHRGHVRLTLTGFALVIAIVFTILGLTDVARMPQEIQLAIHLVFTVVAVLALRIGLQLALLHEAHDDTHFDQPLLCAQCGHVVPDAPFCAACGASTRACSRPARHAQRTDRPTRTEQSGTLTVGLSPGYSVHSGTYAAATPRTISRARLGALVGVILLVVAGALVGLSGLLTKPSPRFVCPPQCGRPPMGMPVSVNPRFTAPDGSFSVAYPAPGSAYRVSMDSGGVLADLLAGDGGNLQLLGRPAAGRQPKDIADQLIRRNYPDTRMAYEIPNAMVGYQPGYGIVADWWPQGVNVSYARTRIVVLVAIKHDLALIAAAVGPYHPFGPDFGSGRPSAVGLQLALDMGQYVNSFSWRGDPAR